jgi:hypothetical protein
VGLPDSSKATVWRGALASCSVRRIVAMWPRSYSSRWWSPSWHWRSGRDAGRRCDGTIRCWASTARPPRRPRLALGHQRRHRGLVRPVAAVRLAHRVPENHAGRGLSRGRVPGRCRSRPRIVHRHERSAAARVLASPLAELRARSAGGNAPRPDGPVAGRGRFEAHVDPRRRRGGRRSRAVKASGHQRQSHADTGRGAADQRGDHLAPAAVSSGGGSRDHRSSAASWLVLRICLSNRAGGA